MKIVGTRAQLEAQRDALDKLEGFPKPPEFVGEALRHLIPTEYTPGALGWSAHICAVEKEAYPVELVDKEGNVVDLLIEPEPGDTYVIDVPDEIVTAHQGKTVSIEDREVKIALTAMAPKPPKEPRPIEEKPASATPIKR